MDLGCLDLCAVSVLEKTGSNDTVVDSKKKEGDSEEVVLATAKFSKNKGPRETCQSPLNAVNRSISQMKKLHRRSPSPLNWFPRRKTETYLKRKIRLLQEVGGMNATLDETLGDSNPHYSRVLREKIAAREAARKAMEARKSAMVEASWCRILRAARIQSREAESLLLKAEKSVAEAFQAAAAMGVIMYDRPDCPKKPCEVESSSVNMGGSTTHTVTATFETAFEVDKEVAAAVKSAFIRLTNCPSSSNKDECRDLLWKISQNPDFSETVEELSVCSSGRDLDFRSELDSDSQIDACSSKSINLNMPDAQMQQMKCKTPDVTDINSRKLVDMMFQRLKCLKEDELASLATIVATCGLNAVLLEVENNKHHDSDALTSVGVPSRRFSLMGTGTAKRKQGVPELPSLEKFLVKHMSKLEKEVHEAKNRRKEEAEGSEEKLGGSKSTPDNVDMTEAIPDLGSILVKKHASKLEKEIEVAKKVLEKEYESKRKQSGNHQGAAPGLPSLDMVLVKHMSRLEREVQEAKNMRKNELKEGKGEKPKGSVSMSKAEDFGNILVKKHASKLEKEIEVAKKTAGREYECKCMQSGNTLGVAPGLSSLDKVLVKHMSRLEREVQEAKNKRNNEFEETEQNLKGHMSRVDSYDGPDLASTLAVTHSPVLEKEITQEMELLTASESTEESKHLVKTQHVQDGQSLDKCLVKHISRLEREVQEAKNRRETEPIGRSNALSSDQPMVSSQVTTDGNQLGKENIDTYQQTNGALDETVTELIEQPDNENTIAVPPQHPSINPLKRSLTIKTMSRIERAKLEAMESFSLQNGSHSSLDRILVKPVHRLEREKMQAIALRLEEEKGAGSKEEMLNTRRKESQDDSVGSLDQILVKHQSQLEKEKLALSQQPADQINRSMSRREARERELQEAWGGLSLGNSVRPHVSRLEKDKAAWRKAEEEERRQVGRET